MHSFSEWRRRLILTQTNTFSEQAIDKTQMQALIYSMSYTIERKKFAHKNEAFLRLVSLASDCNKKRNLFAWKTAQKPAKGLGLHNRGEAVKKVLQRRMKHSVRSKMSRALYRWRTQAILAVESVKRKAALLN